MLGKAPNHLKLRILKRENEVLKCDVIFFSGLSISAVCQRSKKLENHKLITCQHLETVNKRAEQISETCRFCIVSLVFSMKNKADIGLSA